MTTPSPSLPRSIRPGIALTGLLGLAVGVTMYIVGVVSAFVFLLATQRTQSIKWTAGLIWYSGIPTIAGAALLTVGLVLGWSRGRVSHHVRNDPLERPHLTIVLTAFNDEQSIGEAVLDFLSVREPREVVVVDNNSTDTTAEVARSAGARVVTEARSGYGWCVYRSLLEGVQGPPGSVVVLCEGDRTFRSGDIEKLLAFLAHGDIANGTRTASALVQQGTQLTPAMHFGNLIAGKLLDLKYPGQASISDLGTTYKAIRQSSLGFLLTNLDPNVNLEFNAHLLDRALSLGLRIVEVPITFWPRVGESKGGNINHRRAARVGLRMVRGIVFGWRRNQLHDVTVQERNLLKASSP